jgi:mannose/fructose/N-acetylgalactosamine-specific phosphotransferase system component IID
VSYLRGFGRFWWDFVVGDEWRIALIVAVATALGAVAAADGRIRGEVIACLVAVGVMAAVCDVVIAAGRRSH